MAFFSTNKYKIILLLFVASVFFIFYIRPLYRDSTNKSGPAKLKSLVISSEDLNDSESILRLIYELKPKMPEIFLKIESSLKFDCDFNEINCQVSHLPDLNDNSWKTIAARIKSMGVKINFIYDLNLNNFNYKMHFIKSEYDKTNRSSKTRSAQSKKLIFSDPNSLALIEIDFRKKMALGDFEKIYFGSDLDFYFSLIRDETVFKKEIDKFWATLKNIKKENLHKVVSTCFNYEHLRSYFFWGALNRTEIHNLEVLCLSSYPTQISWAKKYGVDLQLAVLEDRTTQFGKNYFDSLIPNTLTKKTIHIIGFGYPLLKEDDETQLTLLDNLDESLPSNVELIAWETPNRAHATVPTQHYLFNQMLLWDIENFELNQSGYRFFK